jgi:predicted metal-dependent hydrolase
MTEPVILVRKPALDFEQPIERFYFAGNPIKTHIFNALNLLFPDGERFFVKSVHDHEKDVHDPALLRDIKAFAGQEGQHAHQHERFFAVLEQQGYRFGRLLEQFRGLALWSRKLPRWLRLSITAGAEHYTATMAALLLEHDMLEGCDPTLRDLILWHAVEEIEHKHVAYDVLVKVYRFSYPLRIVGFIAASAVIAAYTAIGLRLLLRQDGRARRLTRAQFVDARRALGEGKELSFRRALRRSLARYFVPGFHPNHKDDRALLATFVPQIAQLSGSGA